MAVLIKKLILLFFLAFLSLILFGQKVQAENPSRIIFTPPRVGQNGDFLVKTGEDNTLSFGICGNIGNPPSNPPNLKITLTGDGYSTQTVDFHGDYTVARTSVPCNDTTAFGPAQSFTYNPAADDDGATKSFTAKYYKEDGNEFVMGQFDLHVVAEWPDGSTSTSWNPSDVNIATLTNMININDIFSGNRFDLSNQVDFNTPEGLVQKVADVLLILAGILAVIAFIWSGYQFIISSGDSAKVEKAKKAMISAFIGVVLIIFAYSIIRAVDIFSSPPLSSSIPEAKFE